MIVFVETDVNKKIPEVINAVVAAGYKVTEIIKAEGIFDACVSFEDYDIQIGSDGVYSLTQWNYMEHDYDYLYDSENINEVLGAVK